MGQCRAVTQTIGTQYRRASKAEEGKILDELCAMTGWHRHHARKALVLARRPRIVAPRPLTLSAEQVMSQVAEDLSPATCEHLASIVKCTR